MDIEQFYFRIYISPYFRKLCGKKFSILFFWEKKNTLFKNSCSFYLYVNAKSKRFYEFSPLVRIFSLKFLSLWKKFLIWVHRDTRRCWNAFCNLLRLYWVFKSCSTKIFCFAFGVNLLELSNCRFIFNTSSFFIVWLCNKQLKMII